MRNILKKIVANNTGQESIRPKGSSLNKLLTRYASGENKTYLERFEYKTRVTGIAYVLNKTIYFYVKSKRLLFNLTKHPFYELYYSFFDAQTGQQIGYLYYDPDSGQYFCKKIAEKN